MIARFKPGKKKCANECGKHFDKSPNQPFQQCCSIPCALEYNKRKEWLKQKKKDQDEVKVLKEQWKRHGDWLKDLEEQINKIARLIDREKACTSCGHAGKPQAGHYNSVGSAATLRFNLHNIWIQCYQCNVPKSGNIPGYDEGIIKMFGRDYWEYLKFGLKNIYHSPLKLSIPEIKEKIAICKNIINDLKDVAPMEDFKRIESRDYFNSKIGIYQQPYCE